jgi:hypothetical protein
MTYFRKPPVVLFSFLFPIVLGGCDAKPECDSFETRNAVLQAVSDDHNDALGEYAAKNSTTASDAGSEAEKSRRQPFYVLGEKMVTTSISNNKRTLSTFRKRRRYKGLKGSRLHRPTIFGWQDSCFGRSISVLRHFG